MKNIIVIPDSFKSVLSSAEICGVIKERMQKFDSALNIIAVPVADGGEGSLECFYRGGAEKVENSVCNPFFEKIHAHYLRLKNTAVIESAVCCGLTLAAGRENPARATTFGVGELISDAAENGVEKIIIGIGGSATNDAGCGALCALGIKFFHEGVQFVPTGGTLCDIDKIDAASAEKYKHIKFEVLCDVNNPLYGVNGAAYVYAAQKGADKKMIENLDAGLRNFASVTQKYLNKSVDTLAGGGAAGGMGAGLWAYLGASLKSGIETILDYVDFDALLENCDMVITGEGRFDNQSFSGKVISGVARRTKKKGIPLIVIAGDVTADMDEAYRLGVTTALSTNRRAVSFEQARLTAKDDLAATADSLVRLCMLHFKE